MSVPFKKGDRIVATGGVCPGHHGVVTGVSSSHGNTVCEVTYDSGRKDRIFTHDIRHESPEDTPFADYEVDAGG